MDWLASFTISAGIRLNHQKIGDAACLQNSARGGGAGIYILNHWCVQMSRPRLNQNPMTYRCCPHPGLLLH